MRFGSLFSGIGGFDLGFERAGMQCVWQCEVDKKCQSVLRRHWPEVTVYDDVRDIGTGAEAVDLVCGGFPCQDVSVAGRRAGLAGERSGLWHEFHRVLECVRPHWVVIENVPGLLSSNKGRDFGTVLKGLVELGYGVCWRVLDSQYHGVAQRRRRVFVVGHLGDGRAAQVLFERESLCRNPAEGRKAGQKAPTLFASGAGTERTASCGSESEFCIPILEAGARTGSGGSGRNGGGIGAAGDPMFTLQAAHQHAVARPLGAHTGGSRQDLDNDTYVTHALTASPGASEDGTGRGTPLVAACLVERDAKGADSDTKPGHLITTPAVAIRTANTGANGHGVAEDVTHTLDGAQGQAVAFQPRVARNGRGAPSETAYPLTAEAGKTGKGDSAQCVATPATVRRLTPTECERLQGFPDGWTDGQADSPRYRQLGNAVTVNVAEWIGRRIMEVAG